MTTELEYLSQNLYCLRSELLGPVITINGSYKLLIGKVPDTVSKSIEKIGYISGVLLSELQAFPGKNIDLQSPENAAKQLRSLSSKWNKATNDLSTLVGNVNIKDIHLDDVSLEKFIKEIIPHSLQKFQTYLQYLELAQPTLLTQKDGFEKILKIDITK
jgi:hypothetical protein